MSIFKNNEYNYTYLLGKSPKINKSDSLSEYENFVMYLAPHTVSGVNICPFASNGCAKACLYTSGRGRFTSVQETRIRRTRHYIENRPDFLKRLKAEVLFHSTVNDKIAVRLNGTSDINFNSFIRHMGKICPNVIFYDYTKNIRQAIKSLDIPNYHVTFSRSESNKQECFLALANGINVAVVFNEIPSEYYGVPVINGDISDTRFLDAKGHIIGLSAKGMAKKDVSGFVVR
jgi:hypothetical protein